MRAYERLLTYVKYGTASSETSGQTPSTESQFALAEALVRELKSLGLADAAADDKCYVYATLPATPGKEDVPALGFIAHLDTSPDFEGNGVSPRLIPDYDGGDVPLGTSGRVLHVSDFPHLKAMRGRTLIVTDGETLLGADDKAGIAEIMTMLERLQTEHRPHGKICVAFTPDEEIGAGADHFDVARFGAAAAYTLDGDVEGGIEYENFNAAAAVVTVHGFNIHPGDAKDKMINAGLVAMELNALLPKGETPRDTSGYEGFFHLTDMAGDVEKATLSYIIRDHDASSFDRRQDALRAASDTINAKYGAGTASVELREQYRNMAEIIAEHKELIDRAVAATKAAGATPVIKPIRGGTDGARLSFMGLPCPNLGTGGHAYHGPFEHISAEGMDIATDIICRLAEG